LSQGDYIPAKDNALIVHPDVAVLSTMQSTLSRENFVPILARDLPTALLAISQHHFELCIIPIAISAQSDGWALASVFHTCFPYAFLAMIAPEPTVLILQTAINAGVTQLYLDRLPAAANAEAILRDYSKRENIDNKPH
jgi:DNA-binding NtrC family response regulator